jgi:hypothetical protein
MKYFTHIIICLDHLHRVHTIDDLNKLRNSAMAQPCKAAMAARVGQGHLLDNFKDSRQPSLLSPRFRRVPVDGCHQNFAPRLLITRSNPSTKRSPNSHKNRPGQSAWTGRPRVFLAHFWPIFRGRAYLAIVIFCLLDCVAFSGRASLPIVGGLLSSRFPST